MSTAVNLHQPDDLKTDLVSSSENEIMIAELKSQIAAISRSQAVIEFNPDGIIQTANQNFLSCLGYSLDEIKGKHHQMFCESTFARSPAYQKLWENLKKGEFQSGEFKRIGKDGKEVWIQGSYNPIFDAKGIVVKVIKYATDITAQKVSNSNFESQLAAISKSQAVIEFGMDGIIQSANDNFLNTLGYSLEEVRGQHHRMFCDKEYVDSSAYQAFWKKLRNGDYDSGEYKRIGKGGKEVWIQASYNPIMDLSGKPFKIVKYASDISSQKLKDAQLNALSRAQAVIEFTPDGTIIEANDNFLKTLRYQISEIKGKHHSMFCSAEITKSPSYQEFWNRLKTGHFQSNQFPRIAKDGSVVWIQASYIPVFDLAGTVFKVVKYATDITSIKEAEIQVVEALSESSEKLAAASAELTATATQMSANADKTTQVANKTVLSSDQVSQGVRTVAVNTEEMTASIKEIARNANDASSTSASTVEQARKTNSTIMKLGESSRDIGNVIKVISSIAQQTNLLALNATIEAARAGDAGRGFAVVATEVKELAKQTALATEDITNKIAGIQRDSSGAIEAVATIGVAIEKLNNIAGSIASSVEEQSATTNEVSRIVQESSRGVTSISENIKIVSSAASETAIGSTQVLEAAKSLSELAVKLADLVKKIKR